MIHYTRVVQGILCYVKDEMTARLAGSWKAWALGLFAAMTWNNVETLMQKLSKNNIVTTLGLIEGENVNVDAIMPELRKQAQNSTATINIPMIGAYTIGLADVDALDRYIRG